MAELGERVNHTKTSTLGAVQWEEQVVRVDPQCCGVALVKAP
jgi:hypothetical protein